MARLSFRCTDEMVKQVDTARGREAREGWLRRTVEQALGSSAPSPAPAVRSLKEETKKATNRLDEASRARAEMFRGRSS